MKLRERGFTSVEVSIAIVLGALLLLVGIITYNRTNNGSTKTSPEQLSMQKYDNATFGFSLSYPAQWGKLQEKSTKKSPNTVPTVLETASINYGIGDAQFSGPMGVTVSSLKNEDSVPNNGVKHTSASSVQVMSYEFKAEGSVFQTLSFAAQGYRVLVNIPIFTSSNGDISPDELGAYHAIVNKIIKSVTVK